MSKYAVGPIDFSALHTVSLHAREGKVRVADFASVYRKGAEHNLDVIKTADWIVELGPDGGEYGGRIVAAGSPEQLARSKKSYTAEALRKVL